MNWLLSDFSLHQSLCHKQIGRWRWYRLTFQIVDMYGYDLFL